MYPRSPTYPRLWYWSGLNFRIYRGCFCACVHVCVFPSLSPIRSEYLYLKIGGTALLADVHVGEMLGFPFSAHK